VIIQRVVKGIGSIDDAGVQDIFDSGILCNWWRNLGTGLPQAEIPGKLTDRNLDWHQNSFDKNDPLEGGQKFSRHTPFISTTAGTVCRDTAAKTNSLTPAWRIALYFATDHWLTDGWLFYCHLFLIGRRATVMEPFSEELRELNIYHGYSLYQPEGEITAKIVIPTAQIERADFWSLADVKGALQKGVLPAPARSLRNTKFLPPDEYNNQRDLLL
jgi:hypothetical protein